MSTLTFSFVNTSDAPLTIFGRTRIYVLGSGKTEVSFPDTERVKSLIARLRREYPLLKIVEVVTSDKPAENSDSTPLPSTDKTDKADAPQGGKPKDKLKTDTTTV